MSIQLQRVSAVCSRCGERYASETAATCPHCGYDQPDENRLLLGSSLGDGVLAILVVAVPVLIFYTSLLRVEPNGVSLLMGATLLLAGYALFFTRLRPYTHLRRVFAVATLFWAAPVSLYLVWLAIMWWNSGGIALGVLLLMAGGVTMMALAIGLLLTAFRKARD